MKILTWSSKYGDTIVCARTPKEEAKAWLYIFQQMDDMDYYCDLDEDETDAYEGAKKGDGKAAKWLLEMRIDYEYEQVTVEHAVEP